MNQCSLHISLSEQSFLAILLSLLPTSLYSRYLLPTSIFLHNICVHLVYCIFTYGCTSSFITAPIEYKLHEIRDSVSVPVVALTPRMDPGQNRCSIQTYRMDGWTFLQFSSGLQHLSIFSPFSKRILTGSVHQMTLATVISWVADMWCKLIQ